MFPKVEKKLKGHLESDYFRPNKSRKAMAKDIFHDNVRIALENDGWKINFEMQRFGAGSVNIEIDLGAERIISAEKEGEKIAVEVKSFVSRSVVHDFEEAYGQFKLYRKVLAQAEPERYLWLAVPKAVYETFFQRPLIREIVEEEKISLLAYDASNNKIVLWKK